MQIQRFSHSDWGSLEKRFRTAFLNSVSGFKNAVLIGSADQEGHTNLAIFNSMVHVGADPPLLGFVLRPPSVPRHTYENLRSSGYATVNLVSSSMAERAHRTSARFPQGESEFERCGFKALWEPGFPAPYVQESPIRIGVTFEEEHPIQANGTVFIVVRIQELYLPDSCVGTDGYIDAELLDLVCTNGLDAYFRPKLLGRFPYAKP